MSRTSVPLCLSRYAPYVVLLMNLLIFVFVTGGCTMKHNNMPETVTQRIERIQQQQTIEAEVHALWTAPEAKTDTDRIVNAINALNRSWDKRLERMNEILLLIARSMERR